MSNFEVYAGKLKQCQVSMSDKRLPPEFALAHDGDISIFYAPFDYVNTNAKIVICGITPGLQQALLSVREAAAQLNAGQPIDIAKKRAKEVASFGGAMRKNLTDLLDCVGVNRRLGINSCSALFSTHSHLVHYTSALRYPVFVKGENYSGKPCLMASPLLKTCMEKYLIEEIKMLPKDCLYVPLGPVVSNVFEVLQGRGVLRESQVLAGLPHPSGANAERISYFLGRKEKEKLSAKTNAETLDRARHALIQKLLK